MLMPAALWGLKSACRRHYLEGDQSKHRSTQQRRGLKAPVGAIISRVIRASTGAHNSARPSLSTMSLQGKGGRLLLFGVRIQRASRRNYLEGKQSKDRGTQQRSPLAIHYESAG